MSPKNPTLRTRPRLRAARSSTRNGLSSMLRLARPAWPGLDSSELATRLYLGATR